MGQEPPENRLSHPQTGFLFSFFVFFSIFFLLFSTCTIKLYHRRPEPTTARPSCLWMVHPLQGLFGKIAIGRKIRRAGKRCHGGVGPRKQAKLILFSPVTDLTLGFRRPASYSLSSKSPCGCRARPDASPGPSLVSPRPLCGFQRRIRGRWRRGEGC